MVAAQVIGILAVTMYVLSYQQKKRKNIILLNATSCVLYVLQYIMLGAFEGATLDILSALSAFTASNKNKKNILKYNKIVVIALNLAMLISGLALYKNIFSLCPIAGAILQTNALWITDEKRIRLISFLGAPFWLVYNIVSCAYGSAIGSMLSIISIGVAILRYDILPNRKK